MKSLDSTDHKLLQLVQQNARFTIKELAAKLHLSTTPVFERLKRLEKEGVIEKYVALLNPRKLMKNLTGFIHITIIDHSQTGVDSFANQVISYGEVVECHHITGEADFIVKVIVKDINEYNTFLRNKLSTVPNIGNIRSSFSLNCNKFTTALEVD